MKINVNGVVKTAWLKVLKKTKAMLILSNAKESRLTENDTYLNINIDGTQIKKAQEKRFSVIIDTNLTWHSLSKEGKSKNCFQSVHVRKNKTIFTKTNTDFVLQLRN